jgi:hypothetical protein
MVLINFPLRRALGLHNLAVLNHNELMLPQEMFAKALKSKNISHAIRLLASVKALQTKVNIVACCRDADSAFDLLRFVPAARDVKMVLDSASADTRVARLIAEDLADLVTDAILASAINGEDAWADRYRRKFGLSAAKIKKLKNPGGTIKSGRERAETLSLGPDLS